jgi:hypothetical protein
MKAHIVTGRSFGAVRIFLISDMLFFNDGGVPSSECSLTCRRVAWRVRRERMIFCT